jgi:hypothetical protein
MQSRLLRRGFKPILVIKKSLKILPLSPLSLSPSLPLSRDFGGGKVGHKPGSVLSTASNFRGQLSIWDACYQTPQAVPKNGTGKKPTVVPPTLLPTGVYLASTSRCCWCALTAPLHPYQISCCLPVKNSQLLTNDQ